MKRFALLIVAVLSLVGCSSNSPVAPPDVIYNVTGGEALFKVSLKDQPLVVDSVVHWDQSPAGFGCYMHYEIPFIINSDSVLCMAFPKYSYLFGKTGIDSVNMNSLLCRYDGVVFFGIADSSLLFLSQINDLNIYEFNRNDPFITFKSNVLKVSVVFLGDNSINSNDTTGIINKAKKDLEDSWFTFKVYKTANN